MEGKNCADVWMKSSSVCGKEELNYMQIRKAGNDTEEKRYKQRREKYRAEQSKRAERGKVESRAEQEIRVEKSVTSAIEHTTHPPGTLLCLQVIC